MLLDVPSRDALTALTRAAHAVVPSASLGFARSLDDARVSVLYTDAHGIGTYILNADDVPDVLLPQADGLRQADRESIQAHPLRAIEWRLLFLGVQRVLSVPLPGIVPATRFWIALSSPDPLTSAQIAGLEAVAETSASLLDQPLTPEQATERVRRLELTAGLLPALFRVLDVREVFEHLSAISQEALPHDLLTLGLFNDDLTRISLYAQTGGEPNLTGTFPQLYPPAVTRAWAFDIVDDRATHPLERERPPTKLGVRASLRLPIRFDDRVIGGLGFGSFQPGRYTSDDIIVGRRLADYVTVALSHHALAEEGRRAVALRERAANLELLDDLLAARIDSGGVVESFDRISAIAQKVMPHDALVLPVILPDGRHARIYASTGFREKLPEVMEVPEAFLRNPEWEYEIIDDISLRTEPHNLMAAKMGFRSAIRVPVRLDGRYAGALVFGALTLAAFRQADVQVARRIADRIALTLAREREVEASKRADEASARASKLESRVRALTEELDARTGYRRVVGESKEWRQVLKQATQVAPNDTTVLLLGESGTGKEVVARLLHRGSPRANGPFIALNCAALPEQLLEAELFGYERGAYTGATQTKPGQLEQASGGTLLLDEVGEMSLPAQAKFLRVLQEREFQRLGGTRVLRADTRIVAATNRDLQRAIGQGLFREDLYYRLNVFAIRLPALRDRRDDILPLSEAFLAELGRGLGRPPAGISRDARELLIAYHWPGNVRELRNILERAAILCEGGLITAEHLALTVPSSSPVAAPPAVAPAPAPPAGVPARPSPASANDAFTPSVPPVGDLPSMERQMIEQALNSARFNKSKAAKSLGLTRHQLYVRMRKYAIE